MEMTGADKAIQRWREEGTTLIAAALEAALYVYNLLIYMNSDRKPWVVGPSPTMMVSGGGDRFSAQELADDPGGVVDDRNDAAVVDAGGADDANGADDAAALAAGGGDDHGDT